MKQAAILLRQTQYTITEIASQAGYENQSKFATAFRDILNIAPSVILCSRYSSVTNTLKIHGYISALFHQPKCVPKFFVSFHY